MIPVQLFGVPGTQYLTPRHIVRVVHIDKAHCAVHLTDGQRLDVLGSAEQVAKRIESAELRERVA